jgi:hypothetical protein
MKGSGVRVPASASKVQDGQLFRRSSTRSSPASALTYLPPGCWHKPARDAFPHHRLGHYVRFDMEALKEWLKENKITAPANRFRPR